MGGVTEPGMYLPGLVIVIDLELFDGHFWPADIPLQFGAKVPPGHFVQSLQVPGSVPPHPVAYWPMGHVQSVHFPLEVPPQPLK